MHYDIEHYLFRDIVNYIINILFLISICPISFFFHNSHIQALLKVSEICKNHGPITFNAVSGCIDWVLRFVLLFDWLHN